MAVGYFPIKLSGTPKPGCDLALAEGGIGENPADTLGDRFGGCRVDQEGSSSRDLGSAASLRRNHLASARHRLYDRDSESLVPRGQDEALGRGIQGRQVGIWNEADLAHPRLEVQTPDEIEVALKEPTFESRHDEVYWERGGEQGEGAQQIPHVFERRDAAEE